MREKRRKERLPQELVPMMMSMSLLQKALLHTRMEANIRRLNLPVPFGVTVRYNFIEAPMM